MVKSVDGRLRHGGDGYVRVEVVWSDSGWLGLEEEHDLTVSGGINLALTKIQLWHIIIYIVCQDSSVVEVFDL